MVMIPNLYIARKLCGKDASIIEWIAAIGGALMFIAVMQLAGL